jgi:hypothetical protein
VLGADSASLLSRFFADRRQLKQGGSLPAEEDDDAAL